MAVHKRVRKAGRKLLAHVRRGRQALQRRRASTGDDGQELPFYIYGRIDYMDVYKNWRATYFCQLYNAGMPRGARSSPHYYHNYEYPPP